MTALEARDKILKIYNNSDKPLPDKIKKYLKEEIEEFDRQSNLKTGEGYWQRCITDDLDKKNPNNILIFYLLGRADKPCKIENHKWRLSDPPDIDVDFESQDRNNVIEYLKKKYGEKRVAPIGTIGTLKLKSAVQDISRVLGIPASESFPVTTSLKDLDEKDSLQKIRKDYSKLNKFLDDYPEVTKHIEKITGCYRHYCLTGATNIVVFDFEHIGLTRVKIEELLKNKENYSLVYLNEKGKLLYTNDYEVISTGKKEVYEIEFEDGTKIQCTEDHKWFTNEGVIPLKNFNSNTEVKFKHF
jgi:hypothetical protein